MTFKDELSEEMREAIEDMRKDFNRLQPWLGPPAPTPWWRKKYYTVRYHVRNMRERVALVIAPWLGGDRW